MDSRKEKDVKNIDYSHLDLRTDYQKRRDVRNQRIIETYKMIRTQHPDVKLSRIYPMVADIVGDISVQTVRNVVRNL